jgi:uncharacterized cupredoxin-like copper-binding protein
MSRVFLYFLIRVCQGAIGFSLCLVCFWGFFLPSSAFAQPKQVSSSLPPLQEIKVSLGDPQGQLKFFPDHLNFIVGQKYKLILDNPSPTKHYFTAKDFADASWTQKVDAGKVEIKGAIHELELKPTAIAEWVIIPLKAGKYELHCSIPGHASAGMVGEISIANP